MIIICLGDVVGKIADLGSHSFRHAPESRGQAHAVGTEGFKEPLFQQAHLFGGVIIFVDGDV